MDEYVPVRKDDLEVMAQSAQTIKSWYSTLYGEKQSGYAMIRVLSAIAKEQIKINKILKKYVDWVSIDGF